MNCIGDTLAPRIIAEIGDVRRFNNKHSLIAYAGIDSPLINQLRLMLQNGIFPSMTMLTYGKQDMKLCSP